MKTLKSKFYIILILVFFSYFNFVSAQIIFNEVELAPTESRFIELYNTGSSSVDLTGWYIQRKTATGTTFGSLVSKTYFEGISIKSGDYLLISKTSLSNSDIVVDNLTLTESNSLQIKNSSQEVVDTLDWTSIPEGRSLQRISGNNWITATPTPGSSNEQQDTTSYENEDITNIESSSTSSYGTTKKQEDKSIRTITAKIIIPKIVFAGIPFSVNSLVTTNKKETLAVGGFKWNMGDGTAREDSNSNQFEHTYFYPGEYVVSLDFSERKGGVADISDRFIIKVVPAEIFISGVGNSTDPYIEIENKSNYEIVLSDWIIIAGNHYFRIPEGTTLLANKKLKFSSRVTGFSLVDLINVMIKNSKGETMVSYPEVKIDPVKVYKSTTSLNTKKVVPLEIEEQNKENDSEIINLNDLGVSAGGARTSLSLNHTYWGLGGVIVIGIMIVLFLPNRKEEIGYLEDEIRAEDIKIIE